MITASRLDDILSRLRDRRVLVIGDFFLDKYLYINPVLDEPSIETGETAYQVIGKQLSPGAAGTVTNNMAAMGYGSITALTAIGNDGEGFELLTALKSRGINTDALIISDEIMTPTYTKPMYGGKEINRLDIKNRNPIQHDVEDKIISKLLILSEQCDAIVVMDQVTERNCGVITDRVRAELSRLGQTLSIPIIADSRLFIGLYDNVTVKCNHHELLAVFSDMISPTIEACGHLMRQRTGRPVFVTAGERGIYVFDDSVDGGIQHIPTVKVTGEIDICGAGDAATCGITAALCTGAGLLDAATLGNLTSSVTIRQIGTTGTASPTQLRGALNETFGNT